MKRTSSIFLMIGALSLLFSILPSAALAASAPVALFIQPLGEVSYAKNNDQWKPLKRNRFLFAGQRVRTGIDGGGTLLDYETGASQRLSPSSEILMESSAAEVIQGALSAPEQTHGALFASLKKRFAKAQRYTVVRRGNSTPHTLRLAKKLAVSASFPEIAWENLGAEYGYRLVVDGRVLHEAPPSDKTMVRARLAGLAPGVYPFRVTVLKDGKEQPRLSQEIGAIEWLSNLEDKIVRSDLAQLKRLRLDDPIMQANVFDERNLFIPAMDHYRRFLANNPHENDLRPLLIRTYRALGLQQLKKAEIATYNKMNTR